MAGVLRNPFVAQVGADWSQQLRWKVNGVTKDLTAYTAKMQIRHSVLDVDFVHELTTENNGIVLNAVDNINLFIPASVTATIPGGEYRFSLILIDDAPSARALLSGAFVFEQDATV
jgi:hypothetical protein